MQILLTGASGFLGRSIATALVDGGHQVRALVRTENNGLASLGVQQVHGQATAFEDVCAAADGCEAIVHAAGCSDPLASIEDLHDANVRTTECMLGACELVGVPRLLLTSCANAVIGQEDLAGVDERQAYPARWISAYAHTKALAEQRVLAASNAQLGTCVLRPHLLWGAGERRMLPALLDLAGRGKLRLFGEPDCKIDPCLVDNAALAHVLAIDKLAPESPIAGKAYFISQGEPMSIENFLNALLRAGGFPPEKRRMSALSARALATAARAGADSASPLINPYLLDLFSHASWFNLAAAKRDLGYSPKLSTAEGMSRLFTALTRSRMQSRTT
ncbi:NAD-dependent epimerase/dehydratase family protein [Dokdonella sp.]|uniref:NAD-dependent epimerase/dehydratase family protein n=1 Tax=Dokdonella sp. TaxID=2291710 RepID=UPI003C4F67AD